MANNDIIQLMQKIDQLTQKIELLELEKREHHDEFETLRMRTITQIRNIDAKIEDPEKRQILKNQLNNMLKERYESFIEFAKVNENKLKFTIKNILREIFEDNVMKSFRLKNVIDNVYNVKESAFFLCLKEILTEEPFNINEEKAKRLVYKVVQEEFINIKSVIITLLKVIITICMVLVYCLLIYDAIRKFKCFP